MRSDYHTLDTIDSTQNFAKKHVSQFDPKAFTVVTAKEQTKGRGRFNRSWFSPKDKSLYVTYSFRIEKMDHSLYPITLVLALSICEVFQKLGLNLHIKWPNDLFYEGLKMGGILAETEFQQNGHQIFLAFGINGNLTHEELSNQNLKATSLLEATQRTWDLDILNTSIENIFKRDLNIFIQKGFHPFHKNFEKVSFFTGKKLTLQITEKKITGYYRGIDENGALLIESKEGHVEKYISGEIINWE